MTTIQCMNFMAIDVNDSLGRESFKNSDTLFKQNYDLLDLHLKFNSRNTGRDTNKLRIKSWVDFHHLNSNYKLSENHFLLGSSLRVADIGRRVFRNF